MQSIEPISKIPIQNAFTFGETHDKPSVLLNVEHFVSCR